VAAVLPCISVAVRALDLVTTNDVPSLREMQAPPPFRGALISPPEQHDRERPRPWYIEGRVDHELGPTLYTQSGGVGAVIRITHASRFARVRWLAAVACVAASLTASAQTKKTPSGTDYAPPRNPWFADHNAPRELTAKQMGRLAEHAFAALRSGKFPRLDDSTLNTPASSIVFVSWARERIPTRVAVGTGGDLVAAVEDATRRLQQIYGASEGAVTAVKLDVVQHVRADDTFVSRQSSIPNPSLVGIAFTPVSGFAFIPEQLVGYGWVSPRGQLATHRISLHFAETEQWTEVNKWGKVASFPAEQTVSLFESQSIYFDGNQHTSLFRGHRLRSNVNRDDIVQAASRLGDFLVRNCSDDGQLKVDLPHWELPPDGDIPFRDQAATVLGMTRLARLLKRKDLAVCARRLGARLVRDLQPYGNDAQALCLVETRRTFLDANSWLVLALLELRGGGDTRQLDRTLSRLGRFLLRQRQPDGQLVCERNHPSGKINPRVSLSASSIAIIALVRLYEATGQRTFLEAASAAMESIIHAYVEGREMGRLPSDAGLLEAMDALYTFTRNESLVGHSQRLALAILAKQAIPSSTVAAKETGDMDSAAAQTLILLAERSSRRMVPDLLGSMEGNPSATLAAERTRSLLAAARLLRDAGKTAASAGILANLKPTQMFQLAAQLDAPSAMYLDGSEAYIGSFRDHVLAYGLALRCQAVQLLGLLDAAEMLARAPDGAFPSDPRVDEAIAKAQALASRFPRVLGSQGRVRAADTQFQLRNSRVVPESVPVAQPKRGGF